MQAESHPSSGGLLVHDDFIVGTHDTHGQTYWVDLRTHQTAWSREELSHAPLPEGIITNYDATSGCLYYIHLATRRTGWTLAELSRHEISAPHSDASPAIDAPEVSPSPRPGATQLVDREPSRDSLPLEQFDDDIIGRPSVDRVPPQDGPNIEQYYEDVVGPDGTRCSLRCQGMLLKKGHGSSFLGRRNWQSRWFAIDFATSRLTYYTDEKMTICKGCLRLGECSQVEPSNAKKSKGRMNLESPANAYYFVVTSLVDAQTNRQRSGSLELCARTEQEMHEWVQAFSYCVSRLSNAPQSSGHPMISDGSAASAVHGTAHELVGKELLESHDAKQSISLSSQGDESRSHTPLLDHSSFQELAQQPARRTSFDASQPRKCQTMHEDGYQTASLQEKMNGKGLGAAMLKTVIPPPPPPRLFEPRTHSDSMQLALGKGRVIPLAVDNNSSAVGTAELHKPVESIQSPEVRPSVHTDLPEIGSSSSADKSGAVNPPPAISAPPPLGGDGNLLAQIRARTSVTTASVFATYVTACCAGWC